METALSGDLIAILPIALASISSCDDSRDEEHDDKEGEKAEGSYGQIELPVLRKSRHDLPP